jgi:hypothetical protein
MLKQCRPSGCHDRIEITCMVKESSGTSSHALRSDSISAVPLSRSRHRTPLFSTHRLSPQREKKQVAFALVISFHMIVGFVAVHRPPQPLFPALDQPRQASSPTDLTSRKLNDEARSNSWRAGQDSLHSTVRGFLHKHKRSATAAGCNGRQGSRLSLGKTPF